MQYVSFFDKACGYIGTSYETPGENLWFFGETVCLAVS